MTCAHQGPRTWLPHPFVSQWSFRAKASPASMSILIQAHSSACRAQTFHLDSSALGPGRPSLSKLRHRSIRAPSVVKAVPISSIHQACSTDEAATSPGWDKESTFSDLKAQQELARTSTGLHTPSASSSVSYTAKDGSDTKDGATDSTCGQGLHQQLTQHRLSLADQTGSDIGKGGSATLSLDETEADQEEAVEESDEVGTEVMVKMLEDFLGGAGTRTRNQHAGRSDGPVDIEDERSNSSFVIINFYHLADVENPSKLRKAAEKWLKERDIKGRIYVSTQGINAQYSGPQEDAHSFARWIEMQDGFQGLKWSSERVEGHQFPKLRLKFRESLVQLAGGTTSLPITCPEERAVPLSPTEWKEMLRTAVAPEGLALQSATSTGSLEGPGRKGSEDVGSSDDGPAPPSVVVLDVRNGYEWDAGHFVGAERPIEDQFNETPTDAQEGNQAGDQGIPGEQLDVPQPLRGRDPDTPVMMYCTGGIRCDIYSAYLRRKGFRKLYTLEGGVHNYFRQEGGDLWNGSLFVFDGRMAVGPDPSLPAATACARCGAPAHLPHMNCSNIDCNQLFIACAACKVESQGCCSEACREAPRLLRPVKTDGQYGGWHEYKEGALDNARIAEGRGSGRAERRRRRIQKFRERSAATRALRAERRLLAKAAMAAREAAAEDLEGNAVEENEEESETHEDAAYMEQLREKAARTRRSMVLFPSDRLS
eukprot:jgi/Botrbrau1/20081/Bobra.200_1s0084.1